MIKLNRRERLVAYLCISLAVFWLFEHFIFRSLSGRLQELNQEIRAMEVKLARGMQAQRHRDDITREYKTFESYHTLKGSDEENIVEFLRELERISKESELSVSNIKPQVTNKQNLYKEYLIEMRAECSMEGLKMFLYRLNNSVLLMRVEKMTMNLKDENVDILRVNMVISGMVIL